MFAWGVTNFVLLLSLCCFLEPTSDVCNPAVEARHGKHSGKGDKTKKKRKDSDVPTPDAKSLRSTRGQVIAAAAAAK